MSERIQVALGDRSYPIELDAGLIDRAGAILSGYAAPAGWSL